MLSRNASIPVFFDRATMLYSTVFSSGARIGEGGSKLRATPRSFYCSRLIFAPPPLSERLEQAIALPASQISGSYVPPRVLLKP